MSEPVVTHADLPCLRDLREVLDGHINVGPEIALLDRLIAAAMFSAAPPPPTNPEHSFTSRDLQDLYEWWLAQEPPQDAGGHPSLPVHEVVGQKWAQWETIRLSLRWIFGEAMVMEAMDEPLVNEE